MKKILALALVLVLALTATTAALASTDYTSTLIKDMKTTSSAMCATATSRAAACVLAIVAYVQVNPSGVNALQRISAGGNAKIADWGSTVDIYLPTTDGKYLNLFISPLSGKITDFGYTSTISSARTYTNVPMSSVLSMLSDMLSN